MTDVLVTPAFLPSSSLDTGDTSKLGPIAWKASRLFTGGGNARDLCMRDGASATGASWVAPSVAVTQNDLGLRSAVGKVLIGAGAGVDSVFSASPILTSVLVGDGAVGAPGFTFASETSLGIYRRGSSILTFAIAGAAVAEFNAGLALSGTLPLCWTNGSVASGAQDLYLYRDAANTLAQRNGTNAQALRIYNTFTDASNYERLTFTATPGARAVISQESAGSGTARGLELRGLGAAVGWNIDTSNNFVDLGTHTITAGSSIKSIGATAGVGYGTGAGGTVTQATSKATGVTLNTVTGQITMNGAALAAAAKVSFVVTDSAFALTDVAVPCVVSGGTANAYRVSHTASAAGSFTLTVENITAGSLSEAPVIGFVLVKGVTS